jgi:DnaK suppressor protein
VSETGNKTRKIGPFRKSEGFRSRFLKNLMVKREEIENALNRLMDSQKEYKALPSGDDIIEELDHAEREISAQKYYSLLERKNKELEKVEILIRRALENEELGRCEQCGMRIPKERLLIVPEATRCVACQRELEKFDSRRSLAERSFPLSGRKKGLYWEDKEDSDDQRGFILESDMEHIYFVDSEESDLEDNPRGK